MPVVSSFLDFVIVPFVLLPVLDRESQLAAGAPDDDFVVGQARILLTSAKCNLAANCENSPLLLLDQASRERGMGFFGFHDEERSSLKALEAFVTNLFLVSDEKVRSDSENECPKVERDHNMKISAVTFKERLG